MIAEIAFFVAGAVAGLTVGILATSAVTVICVKAALREDKKHDVDHHRNRAEG